MDQQAFIRSGVVILAIPEKEEHIPAGERFEGYLVGATTFWVRTEGMNRIFDQPELEMRGVPALFCSAAMGVLNHWGSYMADSERPVLVEQGILAPDSIEVALRVEDAAALDPEFWKDRDAYRLVPCAVRFQCGMPSHESCTH